MRSPLLTVAALAACLATFGCSFSGAAEPESASPDDALKLALKMRGNITPDEASTLDIATRQLEMRCARQSGIPVEFNTQAAKENASFPDPAPEALWLTTHSTLGYAKFLENTSAVAALKRSTTEGNARMHKGAELITNEVLYGNPARDVTFAGVSHTVTGCAGKAVKDLYKVEPENYYENAASRNHLITALMMSKTSPKLQKTLAEYAKCTNKELKTPESLADRLSEGLQEVVTGKKGVQELETEEKKLLELDKRCKEQTQLPGVFAKVFLDQNAAFVKENEGAMVKYAQLNRNGLQTAATL